MKKSPSSQRSGTAVVEMALVCVMFFMVLFGILEYCRYLFILHVTNNAARDAARYAAIKTDGGNMPGDPLVVASQNDLYNLVLNGTINGQKVGAGMAGMQNNITNFAVNAFTVDPIALQQTPPVVQPLMSGGSQAAWNSAGFNQPIAIQVTGTYKPAAAGLLFLPTSMPFSVMIMVNSEAN